MHKFKLKELRARYEYTQQDMANLLGMSRQRYNYIEKNPSSVKIDLLQKIAIILKVTIDEIYLPDHHTNCDVSIENEGNEGGNDFHQGGTNE